jgi:cytochrome c oxidase subunit 3
MSSPMKVPTTIAPYYFVPGPSKWPLMAGVSMLATMVGASGWVNGAAWGPALNLCGIAAMLITLYFWFGDAIGESEAGQYSQRIDYSFRWSMSWFIFSEVMFFAVPDHGPVSHSNH